MKFFKKIWTTIKIYFVGRKKKSDLKVYEDAKVTIEKGIDKEEILTNASNATNEEERKEILKPLVEFESAKQIVEVIEQEPEILSEQKQTKRRKKLFDLHELENEIKRHQSTLTLLDLQKSSIKEVLYPDTSLFDERINKLLSLLSKNKVNDKVELSDFTVSVFDKDFKQLERLLAEKSAIKRHKSREQEKTRQREIYESNIKKELNKLNLLIGQNKLEDAKLLINRLSKSIKPDYKKGVERLSKAAAKLKEKELEFFKQRQAEVLRKQQAEAERIRIEQEKKLEQQRFAREQAEVIRKKEEAIKAEKENKLKALLTKKFNWREFQRVLQENGIRAFYHFTDYHNLKSIKDNRGLYSWHYADTNGIVINFPGGDTLSRDLDKRYRLQDYVRVSFCTDHPMQYRLQQRGRNLALLEVDIEVAYYENTIFCNINATDSSHKKGKELEDLERIRFSATKRRFVSREDTDFKHHQAEVLVKTWIPLEHITNINAFA
jgi:hypothetical protein